MTKKSQYIKVKITKSSSTFNSWYYNRIGQTFKVQSAYESFYSHEYYRCVNDMRLIILADDCIIMSLENKLKRILK